MEQAPEGRAALELIARCLSGDLEAARQFQETFGELIYGYPMRVYRTPPEDAGDFYVFAFDNGRIFRRLRTFEGRAPLRAYLLGFVLDDLVLEWKRGQRDIETVSLDTLGELPSGDDAMTQTLTVNETSGGGSAQQLGSMLTQLEPAKAVVLKLLYIEDCELTPAEIRYIAEVSGHDVPEVLKGLDELRASVREREAAVKHEEDALDAVQAWIQLYERRVRRIAEDLAGKPPPVAAARLVEERDELERKIQRRQQQRERLLSRARRRKVTAPYKEVAALLNTSVGTVGSQIARLRQELAEKGGSGRGFEAGEKDD